MIAINERAEEKLIELLPKLHDETIRNMDKGIYSGKLCRIIADIRDYFHYLVLNCPDQKTAKKIIDRYDYYQGFYSSYPYLTHSGFYEGYFFGLANLLAVKHEIPHLQGEKINYNDFEISLKETLKDLKIESEIKTGDQK
jgi:hypothetical protein